MRWVSLRLWLMWRVWRKHRFSMTFTVLVESVLPNLRCAEAIFLKLTLMVRLETVPTTFGFDHQLDSLAIELR